MGNTVEMNHVVSPVVSVVMPVFNTERYVARATESILGQSFGDFEFIIIDDGSTDGSRGILERYARQDGRIRLVSRANTGYAVALNEGLGMARGEFVARMDSDDVSKPERFERQVEFFRSSTWNILGFWKGLAGRAADVVLVHSGAGFECHSSRCCSR